MQYIVHNNLYGHLGQIISCSILEERLRKHTNRNLTQHKELSHASQALPLLSHVVLFTSVAVRVTGKRLFSGLKHGAKSDVYKIVSKV